MPCTFCILHIVSSVLELEMTQPICYKNKFGYCKYSERCFQRQVTLVCDDAKCEVFKCEKRHPKICRYYRDFRRCKFTVGCKYKHENQSIKKLDELKLIRIGTNNDDKRAEEKLMEKMLSNQRKRVHKYQVWR